MSIKAEASIDSWGQQGNLTDSQKDALLLFTNQADINHLSFSKFSVETIENASLRFLRARNFDVLKALALLSECVIKKREANTVQYATLGPDDCAKCNVSALKNWYPHNQLGYDKFNRPILFEHSGGINPSAIAQMTTKANLISYHWWTMENTLNKMFEGAVERVEGKDPALVPISTCVLLDFTGLNLSHCSSKMMDHVKSLVQIDNSCYPELLGKMLVINAPWLAVNTWEVVRRWLDPRTQAKIEILGSGPETVKRLLEFISPEDLARTLGGSGPEFYTPIPHTEFLTVPRGSMLKKLVEAERHQRVTVDSYLVEGELLLEIYCTLTSERIYPAQHHHHHPAHEIVGYSTSAHRPFGKESEQLAKFVMKGTAAESVGTVGPVRALYSFETGEHRRLYTIIWSNPAKLVGRSLTYTVSIDDIIDPVAAPTPLDFKEVNFQAPVNSNDESDVNKIHLTLVEDDTPLTSTTDCEEYVDSMSEQQQLAEESAEEMEQTTAQLEEALSLA